MVAAVPMVMQVPNERAMPPSISFHCSSVILPARFSSQYFQVSEPEPSTWPCQLPRNIEIAPINRPGVVLSQPPNKTAPSIG